MRIQQLTESRNQYLYEGLEYTFRPTMRLWENAGLQLKEAALTADQIQQLFKDIEGAATASGSNRTMLGQGKDAIAAVNKAWEDLKTKIQDSAPIKAVDQKYDDVVAKIEKGLGGPDNAVNKVIQKYRTFAKEHPIAQGFIYSALIAAAGISGAGLGGAAVLGLLKMTDKLLQGEKFSSAAYAGLKTGATAFAASKLGDYIKGLKQGDQVPQASPGDLPPGAPKMDFEKYDYYVGDSNNVVAVPKGSPNPFTGDSGVPLGAGAKPTDYMNAASDTMSDNPLASPALKKLAAKVANGEALTPKEMDILDKMELRAVKMSDMVNAPGSSGIGRAGAEITLNTGEKVAGDTAAQMANRHFDALQDLKSKAIELQGSGGGAGDIASKAAGAAVDAAGKAPFGSTMDPDYLQRVIDAGGKSGVRFKISPEDAQKALDWQANNGGQAASSAAGAAADAGGKLAQLASDLKYDIVDGVKQLTVGGDKFTFAGLGQTPPSGVEILKKVTGSQGMIGIRGIGRVTLGLGSDGKYYNIGESAVKRGKTLSEGRVYLVFKHVCETNNNLIAEGKLVEGPMDAIKGAAGKAANWLQTKGKNLTTKVTADKLNSAWQKAGSPTDSEELKKFLGSQGVAADVIDSVYKTLKIAPEKAAGGAADVEQVKQMISKLPTDRKARLLKFLTKAPAKAEPAASKGPSRDAGDGRIEPTMA